MSFSVPIPMEALGQRQGNLPRVFGELGGEMWRIRFCPPFGRGILDSMVRTRAPRRFLRHHGLSLTASAILLLWLVLYIYADPATHRGSFFGNAIADWTGVVVTVIATKYFYEIGSAESRQPKRLFESRVREALRDHSLTIFLALTGLGWTLLYLKMDTEGKWGQVVGNIVSEWTQLLGLVLLTKRLIEQKSKESRR
jgi:hypothetical protein